MKFGIFEMKVINPSNKKQSCQPLMAIYFFFSEQNAPDSRAMKLRKTSRREEEQTEKGKDSQSCERLTQSIVSESYRRNSIRYERQVPHLGQLNFDNHVSRDPKKHNFLHEKICTSAICVLRNSKKKRYVVETFILRKMKSNADKCEKHLALLVIQLLPIQNICC